MNNKDPVIILEPGEGRRPGLYADIQDPVRKVPAGMVGGLGGLSNLLEEEGGEEEGK